MTTDFRERYEALRERQQDIPWMDGNFGMMRGCAADCLTLIRDMLGAGTVEAKRLTPAGILAAFHGVEESLAALERAQRPTLSDLSLEVTNRPLLKNGERCSACGTQRRKPYDTASPEPPRKASEEIPFPHCQHGIRWGYECTKCKASEAQTKEGGK